MAALSSYLQKSLTPGETVRHKAEIHWIIYVWPIFALALGLGMIIHPNEVSSVIGIVFIAASLYGFAQSHLYASTTDLAVTDKKILAKHGFISRNTIEQRIGKIETVQINQGILGRLLDFGDILITGTGDSMTPIKNIKNPMLFRRSVEKVLSEKGE